MPTLTCLSRRRQGPNPELVDVERTKTVASGWVPHRITRKTDTPSDHPLDPYSYSQGVYRPRSIMVPNGVSGPSDGCRRALAPRRVRRPWRAWP